MIRHGTEMALPSLSGKGALDPVPPEVSVVVPLLNEAENIERLIEGICRTLTDFVRFEILLVDDGSTDGTSEICLLAAKNDTRLRVLRHPRSSGQSAAIHSGVQAAKAPVIATLDGDGQNPPENLPALLRPLLDPQRNAKLALVAGQRIGRKDTFSKRAASIFANAIRSAVLQDATRDTGCGLKAFRRDAYLALPFFNHQHRYFPALFIRDGWRVAHVDVTHAPRQAGQSKYTNLGRALVGLSDLMGVAWLIRRRKVAAAQEILPARPLAKPVQTPDAQTSEVA